MDSAGSEIWLEHWSPDGGLVRQVRERQAVLFVGAGASVAAGLPNWGDLLRRIAATEATDDGGRRRDAEALLAANRLTDAASALREWLGPEAFHDGLVAALSGGSPGPLHRSLARLPWRVVVTTNFDDLIEHSLPGWPVVTHRDAHRIAELYAAQTPFVLKAHGTLADRDSIVLDGDDFGRMVWGRPDFQRAMSVLLLTSPIVFVGYSHADLDFDLLMREHVALFGTGGARRYALMRVGNDAERAEIAVLRRKAIQLLAYRDHGEVPAAFERLAERVADVREGAPAAPPPAPALGPGLGRTVRTPASGGSGRACVVVLPGFMGSALEVSGSAGRSRRIWMNPLRLLAGGFEQLDLSGSAARTPRVRASALIGMLYGNLCESLAARHRVLPFSYDWRLDLADSADDLAAFLAREAVGAPACHVVAHGEGGLVAQLCAARHPEVWASTVGEAGRVVCLGTGWSGHFAALQILVGASEMLKTLARLDLRHGVADIQRIFASFPGLYQLLPSPWADASWQVLYDAARYEGASVDAALLARALAFHEMLAAMPLPANLVQVLGTAPSTIDALEDLERIGPASRWVGTAHGDGIVPHGDPRATTLPRYFAPALHGDLPDDRETIAAVLDIVELGGTRRLAATLPARR